MPAIVCEGQLLQKRAILEAGIVSPVVSLTLNKDVFFLFNVGNHLIDLLLSLFLQSGLFLLFDYLDRFPVFSFFFCFFVRSSSINIISERFECLDRFFRPSKTGLSEKLQHTSIKAAFTLLKVSMKLFRGDISLPIERPNELQEILIESCVHVVLLQFSCLLKLLYCFGKNVSFVLQVLHFENLHNTKLVVNV